MATEPRLEVPEHVLQFLGEQQTLTLATASPAGVPHAGTFLYVNDGPSLYFWSRPDTTIAKQVARNPLVSFTIDSYTKDLSQTQGIQGRGEARVLLSGEEVARVAALFGDKFPDLSPGNTMSISFFRIVPTDLEFIDNTARGQTPRAAPSAPSSIASARTACSPTCRSRTSTRSARRSGRWRCRPARRSSARAGRRTSSSSSSRASSR